MILLLLFKYPGKSRMHVFFLHDLADINKYLPRPSGPHRPSLGLHFLTGYLAIYLAKLSEIEHWRDFLSQGQVLTYNEP